MGVFDKLERGLERAVKQPFARVFKAEVQPVEIASAMRGAMDDRAAVLGPGRTMVPNVFTIELAESDYERLSSYSTALTDELVAAAEDHADAQRYVAPGPFAVRLVSGADLETGIFRVRPAAKDGRSSAGAAGSAREYAQAQPRTDRDPGVRPDPRPDPRPDEARDAAYRRPEPRRPGAPASERDVREEPGEPHTRAFAAEAPPARARGNRGPRPVLEVDGRPMPLTAAVTTLGRDADVTVVLDDPGVSRRHAEVRITHDGPHLQVILRDLGSTNGTYLNGEKVGSEVLRDGDRVTMGRTHLTFRLEG
ncbi:MULTISPECIES: FhaA domain-containing protein [unclassified Ornithinimicrobium]|uniref:FhaA domain-containing protein n=1 Tax=unclassified Ornithinimicrobium TaxID=2615080 RepID=UPI00385326DA